MKHVIHHTYSTYAYLTCSFCNISYEQRDFASAFLFDFCTYDPLYICLQMPSINFWRGWFCPSPWKEMPKLEEACIEFFFSIEERPIDDRATDTCKHHEEMRDSAVPMGH